jgi:large conductance mechanosensitive channel
MLKEFREFALKGNVIDMAVGIIIGAAFGTIVSSLVKDVIMPPIGMLIGNVDFSNLFLVLKDGSVPGPNSSLDVAQKAGAVSINYGMFVNHVISFLIVAFAVFMMIRSVNKMKKAEVVLVPTATTKTCPRCLETIPVKATRCGHCTSELKE